MNKPKKPTTPQHTNPPHWKNVANYILIGLGQEAESTYRFLSQSQSKQGRSKKNQPAVFWLFDDKSLENLNKSWQNIIKSNKNSHFFNEKAEFLQKIKDIIAKTQSKLINEAKLSASESSLVIKSPGVPLNHPVVLTLTDDWQLPMTSNTQLFFDQLEAKYQIRRHLLDQPSSPRQLSRLHHHPVVVGVTGTKGKSTIANSIASVLQSAKLTNLLGGNIGVPPLDLLKEIPSQPELFPVIVLELSSHQLTTIRSSPHVAVVSHVTPEHLDYYENFSLYLRAKSNITRFQKVGDVVVYAGDSQTATTLANLSPGFKLTFGFDPQQSPQESKEKTANQSFDSTLYSHSIWHQDQPVVETKNIELVGKHTLVNLLPSVLVARLFEVSNQDIKACLAKIKPLPHRLEKVTAQGQVTYYNDSLATTPEATIAALESFKPGSVVLIAGGYDRGLDFTKLSLAILQNRVAGLVLLPTTGQKIKQALDNLTDDIPIHEAQTMQEAVAAAGQLAHQALDKQAEVVILLSPAAASFNLFKSYQDRGHQFKQAVTNGR